MGFGLVWRPCCTLLGCELCVCCIILIGNVQRVQRVKRKVEQRRALLAQAELRETRTRRKTHRPDYVYSNEFESQASAEVSHGILGSSLSGLKIRMMQMTIIMKRTKTMCLTMMIS